MTTTSFRVSYLPDTQRFPCGFRWGPPLSSSLRRYICRRTRPCPNLGPRPGRRASRIDSCPPNHRCRNALYIRRLQPSTLSDAHGRAPHSSHDGWSWPVPAWPDMKQARCWGRKSNRPGCNRPRKCIRCLPMSVRTSFWRTVRYIFRLHIPGRWQKP